VDPDFYCFCWQERSENHKKKEWAQKRNRSSEKKKLFLYLCEKKRYNSRVSA
jgi:hypothetical protein